MCGRFSQHYTWQQIQAFSQPLTLADGRGNLQPRYNIAPTTSIDIIVASDETRRLGQVRWWLVPGWWNKPLKDVPSTFNARVETVDSGAMFRSAFKSRRCIVPASGFFEWTGDKGDKTPHYISAADGGLLGFAGLWDRWKSPEGEEVVSATIITRPADDFMAKIHTRMPSMLQPADFDAWLSGEAGKDVLIQPAPALQEWIVAKTVNRTGVGDDDPATIKSL